DRTAVGHPKNRANDSRIWPVLAHTPIGYHPRPSKPGVAGSSPAGRATHFGFIPENADLPCRLSPSADVKRRQDPRVRWRWVVSLRGWDRDAIYGEGFRRRVAGMGVTEVVCAPSSPWQNPYAERLIGSIRRECLDHVIVVSRAHLRRLLGAYLGYYHGARTHLSLGKDAPTPRRVHAP